jgi:hypothetical protein
VIPPPSPAGGVAPGTRTDAAPAAPVTTPKDKDSEGPGWKDVLMKTALGGAIGWIFGAILAAALPLSGLFVLGACLAGAGVGMYIAAKKKDK